ncbi:MAG: ABC transporter permease [Thermoanaerobaculia bacterium]
MKIARSQPWTVDLPELWSYKNTLYFFVWRDLKVRYRNTLLGAAWAVIQPLLTMVLFTAVFSRIAKVPSEGVSYPLFAYVALVPWAYFSRVVTSGSASVVGSSYLIRRVYFPRLLLPLASAITPAVDFAIAFALLVVLMPLAGFVPPASIALLPLLFVLLFATALGVACWTAALNIRYRDVGAALPFLMQIALFATPVAYPASVVPERWRALLALNPMTGVVEGFRYAILGASTEIATVLPISIAVSTIGLVTGVLLYNRAARLVADVI